MPNIASSLTAEGYQNPTGTPWRITKIRSILTNKKYKGDALLQKSYTADFLTKKQLKNNGEVPQYYVTGDHEAIISPGVHDFVQAIINQGRKPGGSFSRQRTFSAAIRCANVTPGTGRRPGTQAPNTRNASGGATTNTTASKNAQPQALARKSSRLHSPLLSNRCWTGRPG